MSDYVPLGMLVVGIATAIGGAVAWVSGARRRRVEADSAEVSMLRNIIAELHAEIERLRSEIDELREHVKVLREEQDNGARQAPA